MITEGQWVHSSDGELFSSMGFATRDLAIEEGRISYNGEAFHVAKVEAVATLASAFAPAAGSAVYTMQENAAQRFGESADGWPRCDEKQAEELNNTLRVKIDQWADKHGLHPEFYTVNLVEPIEALPSAASEVPVATREANDSASGE